MSGPGEKIRQHIYPLCEGACGLEIRLRDDVVLSIRGDQEDHDRQRKARRRTPTRAQ